MFHYIIFALFESRLVSCLKLNTRNYEKGSRNYEKIKLETKPMNRIAYLNRSFPHFMHELLYVRDLSFRTPPIALVYNEYAEIIHFGLLIVAKKKKV